jgi:hypothetical protein
MMFMFMNGNNPFMNMFEGAFNFGTPEQDEVETDENNTEE